MKIHISLPEHIAKEIRTLAKQTKRSISWWIQKAWTEARPILLRKAGPRMGRASLKKLLSVRGALQKTYPEKSSVELSHRAFKKG